MASKTTKATAAKAEETTGTAEAAVSSAALGVSTEGNAPVLKKTSGPVEPAIRIGGRFVVVSAYCNEFQEAYRTSVNVGYNFETRMKSVQFLSDSTKIDIKFHTRERIEDYMKESFVIDTDSSRANFKIAVTMENGIRVIATVESPQ